MFSSPRSMLAYFALLPIAALAAALAPVPSGHVHEIITTVVSTQKFVITGKVRVLGSNEPLQNANVILQNHSPAIIATTAADGSFSLIIPDGILNSKIEILARAIGYKAQGLKLTLSATNIRADVFMKRDVNQLSESAISSVGKASRASDKINAASQAIAAPPISASTAATMTGRVIGKDQSAKRSSPRQVADKNEIRHSPRTSGDRESWDREQYDRIEDNPFLAVKSNPRSTFSIDVDRASYGNVRRFLTGNNAPPPDAVRIEEMVNYFPYTLAQPKGSDPIAITTEVAPAPWQPNHRLVRVALQARRIEADALPPSNLVFLIDVSGSMNEPDKLPLVKESLRLLVSQLREQDHVALVVYAGSAGLVLPSTSGANKARIAEAIDRLEAGGSTAGGAGIELAYRTARENFLREGNNRVILATEGDFNVGQSSDGAMERLIESKRSEGTYLTVLGFGTGNIQDAKMEKLAKKGNGNYAYVDNISEARKTLVHELGGTLVTVANDVKLQIEFNPAAVSSYRLIGYEDRLLRDEDFTDDQKDAGDMGAGHSVTALYEVVPVGVKGTVNARGTDDLRYTKNDDAVISGPANELMYVKLRYKKPGESTSRLMTQAVSTRSLDAHTSDDFRFAASVASFGMLLRNSEYKGDATGASVLSLARGAIGDDAGGYRAEFVGLVQRWQNIGRRAGDR